MKINLPKSIAIWFLMLLSLHMYSQQKGTVTDIDGNTYQTVVIGDQEWMAENLRVAKFNNGDAITNAQSNTDWENGFASPLWSNYNNDATYDATYGKLYNHKVVSDNRNVCPDGWHVPTQAEWEALISGLGGTSVAGGKLKATGTDYWNADNVGATNEFGFNALGAGYRDGSGSFINFKNYGDFWTSTLYSSFYGYYVSLNFNSAGTYTDYTSIARGNSIRCIKTQEPTIELPTLTTTTVTNITQTTASSGGAITDDGGADITAKGVVWSTSASPTLEANEGSTNDGTGTAEFNSDLTALAAGTTYYVRAYATNSAGTGYGNEVQFTTSSTVPFTEPAWVHINYQNSPIPSGYGINAQEDSQGNIWMGFSGSIVKYTTEGQMITYGNSGATSEFSSFVLEDDNTIWVCNRTEGVLKFDVDGSWTKYNTDNTSMTSNYIHSIAIDSQGNKWITTNGGGLVKYDDTSWTIWTAENSDLPANSIYSIFIDKNDNIWLGLSGYLAKFDGTTWDIWTWAETSNGVSGTISAVAIDENNNIWIGKDWNLGVAKASINDLTAWTQYNYSNSDYPESRSVAIDFDADGRVWFGTESKGLVVFDGVEWSVFNSQTSTSWPSSGCDWVTSFFTDTKSVRWVGTHDGFILTNSIVPTVTTSNVSEVTETSAIAGGTVDFYGGADITAKGVVWSTSTSPTLDANDGFTADGTGTTEFNSDLTGLTAGTTYYVRAYATNSAGTGYGNEVEFTTEKEIVVPTLTTTTVTNITQTTASSGGAITDDGGADITAKGVVWSTSANPTLDANEGSTNDGTGTAEFNSDLTGLTAGTTYYVRAYATNSAGTGYGNEVEFTTAEESSVDPLSLPFTENFDGEVHDWTIKDLDGDGNKWGIFEDADIAHSGTKFAGVKYNPEGNNDWIISPLLSIPADEEIELSLWAKSQDPDFPESFDIQVSTDGGTSFSKIASETSIPSDFTKYTYDLSSYAGQNLKIAIVCVSVDTWYLFIDDITCAIKGTTSTPVIPIGTEMKAYPNPFTNTLTLESEKGISQVVVMNVSGQVVLARQANGESKLVLEADGLDTGLYIVKLTEVDGTILHTRVVKR